MSVNVITTCRPSGSEAKIMLEIKCEGNVRDQGVFIFFLKNLNSPWKELA